MRQRGLVFIDMVLDSRYGTMKLIDGPAADELVASPEYRNRYTDQFDILSKGRISQEVYDQLYSERTGDNLYHARFTDFLFKLVQDMEEANMINAKGAKTIEAVIDLNVWPYADLSLTEREVNRRAFAARLPPSVKVNVVYIDPAELTPQILDMSYEMMTIYNHEDWLRHHETDLIANPMPNFVLLTPMIASSGVVPEATSTIRDPFAGRSAILCKWIALHYMPPSHGCHNPAIPPLVYSLRQKELARLVHLRQAGGLPEAPHVPEEGDFLP